MKDLGALYYFLGDFGLPLSFHYVSAASGPLVDDPTSYSSLAGALHYLTFTRVDISYVVQHIYLFIHTPRAPLFSSLEVHHTISSWNA